MKWTDVKPLNSKSYVCGYCGEPLASDKGYFATRYSSPSQKHVPTAYIYVCHHCEQPTFFASNKEQTPGPAFGSNVEDIPSYEVAALYDEARSCMKVNAHTAAVMCCRKLLMNVAVALGADEGKNFWQYVQYLKDSGHLPVTSEDWLKHIKDRGNEANHEIKIVERQDAEQLIELSELVLKIVYEVPAKMKAKADKRQGQIVGSPPTGGTTRRAPDVSGGSSYGSPF